MMDILRRHLPRPYKSFYKHDTLQHPLIQEPDKRVPFPTQQPTLKKEHPCHRFKIPATPPRTIHYQ